MLTLISGFPLVQVRMQNMWFISLCAQSICSPFIFFHGRRNPSVHAVRWRNKFQDHIFEYDRYVCYICCFFVVVLNALPSLGLFCQTSCPEQIQDSREAPRIFARHDSLLPRFEEQGNCCKGHSPKAGGIPSALTNNNGFRVLHTAYYFTPRRHFERDSRTDKNPADHPRECTGESACNFTIIGGGCVVCFT